MKNSETKKSEQRDYSKITKEYLTFEEYQKAIEDYFSTWGGDVKALLEEYHDGILEDYNEGLTPDFYALSLALR